MCVTVCVVRVFTDFSDFALCDYDDIISSSPHQDGFFYC